MVLDPMRLFNARKLPKIILAAASCPYFKIPRYAGDLRKYLDTGDLELTAALKSLFSEDASLYTKAVNSGIECGLLETRGQEYLVLNEKGKKALQRYLEQDPKFLDSCPLIKRYLDHGSNIHQKQLTKEDQQKKVDIPSSYINLSEKDKNIFLAMFFFGSLPYKQSDLKNVTINKHDSTVDEAIKSKLIQNPDYSIIMDKGLELDLFERENNEVKLTKKGRRGFTESEKELYIKRNLSQYLDEERKRRQVREKKITPTSFEYKKLSNEEKGMFLVLAVCDSIPCYRKDIDNTPYDETIKSTLSEIKNYEEIINVGLTSGHLEKKDDQIIFTRKGRAGFGVHLGKNKDYLDSYPELKEELLEKNTKQMKEYKREYYEKHKKEIWGIGKKDKASKQTVE